MLRNVTNHTTYLCCAEGVHHSHQVLRVDFQGEPHRPLLRRPINPYGLHASRTFNPRSHLLRHYIPLVFNKRRVAEDEQKVGAVFIYEYRVLVKTGEDTVKTFANGRLSGEVRIHGIPQPARYVGHIPDALLQPLLNGERIMTDNILCESEYIRGPRVEVTVHFRQHIDLDPATTTFQQLRELDLVNLELVNNRYGVNILEMEPNDLFAQLVMRHMSLDTERREIEAVRSLNNRPYTLFFYNWEEDDKRVLFPTYGEEPGTISYFSGYKDFARGRETTAKAGKVLKRISENSSDATIKQLVDAILISQLPDDFYLLETAEDIVNGYRNGPSSCTSKPMNQYSLLRRREIEDLAYHPTAVYGDESDVKMYVLKKGDRIMARALVVPEKMQHIVVYPKSPSSGTPEREARDALKQHLAAMGYSHNPECIVGCTLNKISLPDHDTVLSYPYVDEGAFRSFVLDDCLVCIPGDFNINNFNQRLTTRAKEKLTEYLEGHRSREMKYIHASHDSGGNETYTYDYRLSVLDGVIGTGDVVTAYDENGQFKSCFADAVRRTHVGMGNTTGGVDYIHPTYLQQLPEVSERMTQRLGWSEVNGRTHPANYPLLENFNTVEREGRFYLRCEFVTDTQGNEVHVDRTRTYFDGQNFFFVSNQQERTVRDYLDSQNINAITEGAQHEAA